MTRFLLGDGAPCDLGRLVDTRLLVQANSGGGKSWCLRRLLEQTHGKVQHLVLDPEGEFATLREKFDYVLAARQGADAVAVPRSAKLLAERFLELGVSAIIDIYELKATERVAFVQHFLEALIDAPKKLWHPALVVVDEAHVYCPQAGGAESASAVIDLCTRGRKRGFCAVLATQRLSKLHKDAAAELNNKLIGRTGLDLDMKRAADELGLVGKDQIVQLRQLPDGHFFAFGPAISLEVQAVHIGPVQTTHPKAGARLTFVAPPPTEKIKALLPKLADLPAEAEARERTVAELKRELSETRRQLTMTQRGLVPAPAREKVVEKVRRIEVPILKDGQVGRLEKVTERWATAGERFAAAGEVYRTAGGELVTVARELLAAIRLATNGHPQQTVIPAAAAPVRRVLQAPAPPRPEPAEGLTHPQQRILDALAWFEAVELPAPEKAPLAAMADASSRSSAYQNNVSALRTAGLVHYPRSGLVALTDQGRALATPPDVPATTLALQEAICSKVSAPQARILRALIAAYPQGLTKDELAAASRASAASSAFQNNVSAMRSLGLVEYPSPGSVVAQPVLFLEAPR